jgi:zinc transporter ZupT
MEASSMLESSAATMAFPSGASSIVRAVELGTLPSLGMGLATLLGIHVIQTPPALVGALQHFSAGILLATLGKELLPEMVQAQGFAENAASGVGFFAGVGFLIVLGILLPEAEATDESPGTTEDAMTNDHPTTVVSVKEKPMRLRNRQQSKRREAFALSANAQGLASSPREGDANLVSADDEANDERPLPPLGPENTKTKTTTTAHASEPNSGGWQTILAQLPTAFLTAIVIDAALDGLLIGISTAIDPSTGPILSASLTVESTFFGITIATALRGRGISPGLLLGASALGPVGLLAGSIAGGALAPTLIDSPVLLAGLLGFGTSTILFMVAEELLLEAHEEGGEHIWWVDFQLYTGFFASVMVEKLAGV